MLDEPVTDSFKALTVPDFNKTSMGICVDVWSIFYPLSAKAWVRGSVLFLCSWCHNSPSRPVRNAGNATLCSDSGPGLSWTIKSLSFNLSKKVNYFTVNKQIGSTWEYFLCQKTPFQSWKHYNTYHVMTEFVHTDLSVFCSPAAAPVQPCRINLPCAGGKREKKVKLQGQFISEQKKFLLDWTKGGLCTLSKDNVQQRVLRKESKNQLSAIRKLAISSAGDCIWIIVYNNYWSTHPP